MIPVWKSKLSALCSELMQSHSCSCSPSG